MTIDNGLSQATAEAIIQDSDGYVWIGTNDGLNRYNGSEIKVFDSNDEDENSIISNYITALAEDKNKNLWVVTDEGLLEVCGCPKDKCKEYAEYCSKYMEEFDK